MPSGRAESAAEPRLTERKISFHGSQRDREMTGDLGLLQAAKPAGGSRSAPAAQREMKIEAALLERLFHWVVEPSARLRVKSPKSGLPSASADPAYARAELLRTHSRWAR